MTAIKGVSQACGPPTSNLITCQAGLLPTTHWAELHNTDTCMQGETARSADLLLEGRGGFMHPQSGAWGRGNASSCASNALSTPTRGSPASSVLAALQARHSSGPGARSASPVHDPHAATPHASSDSHGSGSFSKGSFLASRPSCRTGLPRMKRSRSTGETLLVIGEEGGASGIRTSRHKLLLLQSSQLPSIYEDDTLHHRLSSSP
eukprot:1143617-Pelagomonas_calceolata.AAC.14